MQEINYKTALNVRSDQNDLWRELVFDISTCGISYRTNQDVIIIPNGPMEGVTGQVFQLHPDDRVNLMTRLLQYEVLQAQEWVNDAEAVTRTVASFKDSMRLST